MASNTLSINRIILMFQDIANRHQMINQFSYGPLSDINTEGDFKMPYLHIENTTTTLGMTTSLKSTDSILTGWSVTFSQNDIYEFEVKSVSTLNRVNIVLSTNKS